jgi:uncharacterized protein (TIGR03084 family)
MVERSPGQRTFGSRPDTVCNVTSSPGLEQIEADLRAEHEDLDEIVGPLGDLEWDQQTPAAGWAVRDQISHLAFFDDAAALALEDPEAFIPLSQAATDALVAGDDPMREHLTRGRSMTPDELLEWWRRARARLLAAADIVDERARVPWFGPPMGARSFLSARVMETWAHGQDIADTFHIDRPDTDRLRNIAHLGVGARAFSYVMHSRELPDEPVRVELVGPTGATWEWGPSGAPSSVTGPAVDFCLVVTRRRSVSATRLVVREAAASEWMDIAQAFAGPPGPERPAE